MRLILISAALGCLLSACDPAQGGSSMPRYGTVAFEEEYDWCIEHQNILRSDWAGGEADQDCQATYMIWRKAHGQDTPPPPIVTVNESKSQ